MDLMLYGAVPFNLPDDSLAARRARKNGANLEQQRLSLDQLVMLQVANEAAEAIQFILGPSHRPRPAATPSPSPSYRNPELKSYHCPPNTPSHHSAGTSFDFTATDADCSDLSTDDDEVDSKPSSRNQNSSSRKRRRLVSFSDSSASSRRVAHKKVADENSGRKIFAHKKVADENSSRKILARKKHPNNSTNASRLTDDDRMAPRLSFFAEVQKAVGEDVDDVVEQKWRKLGKSLRAIADRFATSNNTTSDHNKMQSPIKMNSFDSLPNGIWSAVLTYVFWKIIKGRL